MEKSPFRARRSLASDQRGNVAMLFAFSMVPVIGLAGGAVDMTRYNRHKEQVLNAMDAAAVALVKRGAKNDAAADLFVNNYINSMLPPGRDPMLHLAAYNATKTDSGYEVTSSGYMGTAFMPVVGITRMPMDLSTEVAMSNGKYEVALALDNTGSMRDFGRIEALRDAAGTLVDDLYKQDGAADRVKMSLVPFVTAVNIKSDAPGVFSNSWIQPTASLDAFGKALAAPVDRLNLFAKMKVAWSGCVEARRSGADDDSEPVDAATKWVPYLWADEPDSGGFANSYLTDLDTSSVAARFRDVAKYDVAAHKPPGGKAVANTSNKGPNAACPGPIVELTSDKARMHREIDKMVPHNTSGQNNSGTNVAEGLTWGWRVLSPGEPFAQGVKYGDKKTTKILVLLSDGRNQIVGNSQDTHSDYTSYGYLSEGRLGSKTSGSVAEKAVDAKVKSVCDAIKAKGIRIYTILFQVDFESTQDIFRDCASKGDDGQALYYYVPVASQLETAFKQIGKDLTKIHVAR